MEGMEGFFWTDFPASPEAAIAMAVQKREMTSTDGHPVPHIVENTFKKYKGKK